MPFYLTPGVYIEEVPSGNRPLVPIGTSTAAFLGVAPKANAHIGEAVACNNWGQFLKEFVGEENTSTALARAVYGFFDNSGGRCYVVNVGENNSIVGDARKHTGLYALESIDEIAIVAAPGVTDLSVSDAILTHCEKFKDRFAILDAPDVHDTEPLKKVGTATPEAVVEAKGESEKPPRKSSGFQGLRPRASENGFGAFYFPWIRILDPLNPGETVNQPPAGHIAGIYARTDSTRGVHKAPANELIRGALGLTYQVTHDEQGVLNSSGVNCIRYFADSGIRVWGARTLAAESSPWRYINVRRLFCMIEETISKGTRWSVFEPNDRTLWKSITRDIKAFLTLIWRDGALMGATPEQAFYVKCDEETNTPEEIDAGRVITEVGIAPVKPAEFIIFRIAQGSGGAEVETQSET